MKTKLCLLASVAMPLFAMEIANAADHAIALSANVPGSCSISSVNNVNNFGSSTTAFAADIENSKAKSKIGSLTINYTCTSAQVGISISSSNDGITGPATTLTNVTNKIHYTAQILSGSSVSLAMLDTSATGNVAATNATKLAQTLSSDALKFDISILPTASSLTLAASPTYGDTLTISINPS